MEIKKILLEGEKGLNKYRNLIGVGVIITMILGIGLILFSLNEQQKLAEKCGFDDGKIKCVCTDDVWNQYQQDLKLSSSENQDSQILTKGLNTLDK